MDTGMNRAEAVARIKAEILAPDWQLNQRRAAALAKALRVVEQMLAARRSPRLVLEMARAALAYHGRYGEAQGAVVLDFLKQALAQLIVFVEDDSIPAERAAEIFNKVHLAFLRLKRQLATAVEVQ